MSRPPQAQDGCLVTGCSPILALLALLIALAVGACSYVGEPVDPNAQSVRYWHDDERGVGCYILWSQAISCVPDEVSK